MICNSGVGLTPLVDGRPHHFSAGGLYDGLALLVDDETESYWNHLSGRAVHGPLAGTVLDTWPLAYTSVGAARRERPTLTVARSTQRTMRRRFFELFFRRPLSANRWVPPMFRRTMGELDKRLPPMLQGLGVVAEQRAVFYPLDALDANGAVIACPWQDRTLHITRGALDGIPRARWDGGDEPMQLFTRWYGFSYTYPACDIGGADAAPPS